MNNLEESLNELKSKLCIPDSEFWKNISKYTDAYHMTKCREKNAADKLLAANAIWTLKLRYLNDSAGIIFLKSDVHSKEIILVDFDDCSFDVSHIWDIDFIQDVGMLKYLGLYDENKDKLKRVTMSCMVDIYTKLRDGVDIIIDRDKKEV